MTRLDALRRLISAPRVEADLGRIGHRVIAAKPDGRELMVNPSIKNRWQAAADRILRKKAS